MTTALSANSSLSDWLTYQERTHPKAIELGLERTREVAQRLGLLPVRATTLTVAGTNGKGSSVTLAAEIYRAAGYRCGRFTSPHLLRYNERVAIDGVEAGDAALCQAFAAIEQARGEIPLTYFEFGTLAALWLFRQAEVQVQVLEVGLGGRLDAVNIVDADCALVTNIGLDHTDWLGHDRDSIGYEKAGIMRRGRPAVCVEAQPPRRLLDHAAAIGTPLRRLDVDFHCTLNDDGSWNWQGRLRYDGLPAPGLRGAMQYRNAAGVLAAVEALQTLRPVPEAAIRAALPALTLAGRYQRVGNTVLDVAHNVESAAVLADNLRGEPVLGKSWLVLGMLADKPVEGVCALLAPLFDGGVVFGGLPPPRGLDGVGLRDRAAVAGLQGRAADTIEDAYRLARSLAGPDDRIVVCGSFLTVAAVAELLFRTNR